MDRFTALRAFCAVVENGSFVGAARALGLSNAAVSKNVSELEADLQARLLTRTTRKLSLTETGEAYYARVSALLADLSEADEAAARATAAPRGPLRIAAPMSFGLLKIAPLMAEFMACYPGVEPTLDLDDAPSDVIGGRYEVLIRARRSMADSGLIVRRIAPLDHVICAAPAYLDRAGTPEQPEDLVGHQALAYTQSDSPARWRLRRNGETRDITVRPTLRANNSLAIREALLGGAGLALIPRLYVRDALADGRLVTALDAWKTGEMWVCALFPSDRNMPARTRAFIDFLANRLAQRTDG